MANYHDPVVVAHDYMTLSKVWHAVAGLYFWEFVTTLDYEWSVFRRHRPFRWTIWIYISARIATLVAVILFLVDINITGRYNCKVETIFLMTFSFLATAAASLLIVLRVLAIWKMKSLVIAMATGAWGTGVIFEIQTIVRIRVESIPGGTTCVVANPQIANLNTLASLTTDIILLFIMLFGLFGLRFYKSSAFGMGRLLWRQGLIWLLVAFVADIIPTVFIALNLNAPIDDIFMAPWVVVSSIAATRIHRDLVDYASAGRTEQLFDSSHSKANGRTEWKANKSSGKMSFDNLTKLDVASRIIAR